jgi:hypothetical protein
MISRAASMAESSTKPLVDEKTKTIPQNVESIPDYFEDNDISEINFLTEGLERSMSMMPEFEDMDRD